MGEHEAKDVLGAGLGIDAGAVGEAEAAGGGSSAEFGGIVAGVAGGGNVGPAEAGGSEDAGDVRLTEHDIGLSEGGFGAGLRKEERVWGDAVPELLEGSGIERVIAEDGEVSHGMR